ncbi:MAG: cytidine deaminase [Clostridia bacterium]|nr:cytidine deaminase [Clostridia bacterium]
MIENLCKIAIEQLEFSYSPYSKCKVGAALLAKSGKIYTGCNIENASFGATNCAERTAFFKAISEGEKDFNAIAIAAQKDGNPVEFLPCGICRQVMAEFCDGDFKIFTVKGENQFSEYTLSRLLPNLFSL